MPRHEIIVIGASVGGVEALLTLARALPRDLPAAIFAVMHIPARTPSRLPEILNNAGPLPALHAVEGAAVEPGHIYVAPPDKHLILSRGRMCLAMGPRENDHRPAIDSL